MASISGMLATTTIAVSKPRPWRPSPPSLGGAGGNGGLVVECSSRPKKKATAHHMKTRPKKTQPWDVRRKGPTIYPPLPPLPPDWTLVTDDQPLPQPPQDAGGLSPAPSAS
ncbi:50S ribosomal protein 6, chloroplastic [Phoenix dactylifera]|uniref:50S ribosomal protein 6, chloroplastic n=1 Tax=Phoenix dactylifera TaxID=42345 RepID=A0A8B9ACU2_PHODC|nr:50S ribosomal protein 6, chloroplastic [Phoenix dactylifera]